MTKEEYRKRSQEYEDARKIAETKYKNSMEEMNNQAIEESGMLENVGRKCKAYGFRFNTDEKFWMMGGVPVYISKVMEKFWFKEEKKPYTVRCRNERYAICTKPYNFKPKTVIYTIVDMKEGIRGTDNMVFSIHDYYNQEDCEQALSELTSKELEISYRNRIPLNFEKLDDQEISYIYQILTDLETGNHLICERSNEYKHFWNEMAEALNTPLDALNARQELLVQEYNERRQEQP